MDPESFQCSVCWSVPAGNVLQCGTGHIVCRECHDALPQPRCPTCRASMPEPSIRCVAIENALQSCELRCVGHAWGCKWIGTAAALKSHAAGCTAAHAVKETSSLRRELASEQASSQTLEASAQALRRELDVALSAVGAQTVHRMRGVAAVDSSQLETLRDLLRSTSTPYARLAQECLAQDLQSLVEHPLPCPFYAAPLRKPDGSRDLFNWECSVPGLPGTLHDGAIYDFTLSFTTDFPFKPPMCKFAPGQRHMHENLYPSGKVCSSLLDTCKGWEPSITVAEVVVHLCVFMHRWNMADPALEYPYRMHKASAPIFRKLVRECAVAASPARFMAAQGLFLPGIASPNAADSMPLLASVTNTLLPLAKAATYDFPRKTAQESEMPSRMLIGGVTRRVLSRFSLGAGLTMIGDVELRTGSLLCGPSSCQSPVSRREDRPAAPLNARWLHCCESMEEMLMQVGQAPVLSDQAGAYLTSFSLSEHAYRSACEAWANMLPERKKAYQDRCKIEHQEALDSWSALLEKPPPQTGDGIEVKLSAFGDGNAEAWRPAVVAEVYHDGCFSTGVPVVLSTDHGLRLYKQMWWYYFEEEGTTWRRAEAGAPAFAARARGGEADPPPGSKRARRGASA